MDGLGRAIGDGLSGLFDGIAGAVEDALAGAASAIGAAGPAVLLVGGALAGLVVLWVVFRR